MKKLIGLVCLLVFVTTAIAITTSATPLKLKRKALTNRINIPLIGPNNACTTQFIAWGTQPYPALGYSLYCNAEADTWLVDVTFKWTGWPKNSGPFSSRSDTVKMDCAVRGAIDTLRTAASIWCEEFYPMVSQGGYFIFAAGESLTDTLWIDSVVYNGSGD